MKKEAMTRREEKLCQTIGDRILQIMRAKKMTQLNLSVRIEKSESYLSRRFNVNTAWSVTDLCKISEALGVDIKDLTPFESSQATRDLSFNALVDQILSNIITDLQKLKDGLQSR